MSGGTAELILFGMVAAFLVLRLRSVLGKRTGFERPAQPVVAPGLRPVEPRPVQHATLTSTRRAAQDHSSLLDAAPDTYEPSKNKAALHCVALD